jgi:hypothetical protein
MPHSMFTARIRLSVMAPYRRFPLSGQADARASGIVPAD